MREIPHQEKWELLCLQVIHKGTGDYWLAGETRLRSGQILESVFSVNTDSGGALGDVFWRIDDKWYRQDDLETLAVLGIKKEDVFPYDWSFAIPLEEDIFHQEESGGKD